MYIVNIHCDLWTVSVGKEIRTDQPVNRQSVLTNESLVSIVTNWQIVNALIENDRDILSPNG